MDLPANAPALPPLDIEMAAKALEGVSQEDAELIKQLYGILETNKKAVDVLREHQFPWLAVQRKTARMHEPSAVWEAATRSLGDFWLHFGRHRIAVRSSGDWLAQPRLYGQAIKTFWSVLRLYASAILYRLHIVGIVNHAWDVEVNAAWAR